MSPSSETLPPEVDRSICDEGGTVSMEDSGGTGGGETKIAGSRAEGGGTGRGAVSARTPGSGGGGGTTGGVAEANAGGGLAADRGGGGGGGGETGAECTRGDRVGEALTTGDGAIFGVTAIAAGGGGGSRPYTSGTLFTGYGYTSGTLLTETGSAWCSVGT